MIREKLKTFNFFKKHKHSDQSEESEWGSPNLIPDQNYLSGFSTKFLPAGLSIRLLEIKKSTYIFFILTIVIQVSYIFVVLLNVYANTRVEQAEQKNTQLARNLEQEFYLVNNLDLLIRKNEALAKAKAERTEFTVPVRTTFGVLVPNYSTSSLTFTAVGPNEVHVEFALQTQTLLDVGRVVRDFLKQDYVEEVVLFTVSTSGDSRRSQEGNVSSRLRVVFLRETTQ